MDKRIRYIIAPDKRGWYPGNIYCPALKMRGYTGFAMSTHDSVTAKLKYILLYNFYVCGSTSMKLILHLVSKVSKIYSQNSGQGPITLGVMSLSRFSKCIKMHFA